MFSFLNDIYPFWLCVGNVFEHGFACLVLTWERNTQARQGGIERERYKGNFIEIMQFKSPLFGRALTLTSSGVVTVTGLS